MKTIKSVLAALIVFAALFMVSCDKEETATAFNINTAKKGTIKGYLWAELDLTNAGPEAAPAGTKVIITVPNDDINPYSGGTFVDTVEVDENGVFEVQVPVGNGNAYVSVYPQPFEAIQIQPFGSAEAEVMKIFAYDYLTKAGSYDSWYLSANQTVIAQFTYMDYEYEGYVQMAQISGKLIADQNDTIVGSEDTRAGIELTFYGDGWNTTVTTTADGEYTVSVPANDDIYVQYSFTVDHIIYDWDELDYLPFDFLYEDEGQYVGDFSGSVYTDIYINAGYGEEVEE